MKARWVLWLALPLAGLGLGSCILDPGACHTGIWLEVDPREVTLRVGDTVRIDSRVERCPDPVENPEVEFVAEDPSVVRVDDGNRLSGVAPGSTVVDVGTTSPAGLMAVVKVTVMPQ